MHRLIFPLLSLIVLSSSLEANATVGRRIPIPIIWGSGESVTPMGDLPDEAPDGVTRELGTKVSVGFVYGHAHLYYADLWTWNGRHVLFDGKRYWELNEGQWLTLLGTSPHQKFGTPIFYRCPLGLTILLTLVLLYAVQPILFPSHEQSLKKARNDPRYIAAAQSVLPIDKQWLRTDFDQTQFESAITSLTDQGISESRARRNLAIILNAVCADRSSQIDSAIQSIHFAEASPTAVSIARLERLIDAIPPSDQRREQFVQSLLRIREKSEVESDTAPTEQAEMHVTTM